MSPALTHRRLRIAAIIAAGALLLSCGGDSALAPAPDTALATNPAAATTVPDTTDTTTDTTETPTDTTETATDTTETATEAPTDTTTDTTEAATIAGVGRAVVDVDGVSYEFVVIQCLRDTVGPVSDVVIEFQLDGVPAETPAATIERLLGVIDADADVQAEIAPVVEFGPILSITRVAGGGELVTIADLDTIEFISDGDPLDPGSRALDVSPDVSGATVTGTTTAGGSTVTVDATCP